jgi:outer membrane cobalamin receptor
VLTLAVTLSLISLQSGSSSPSTATVTRGVVVDVAGNAVPGARVTAAAADSCETLTAADGSFVLPCAAPRDRLHITAAGHLEQVVMADESPQPLRVVLDPVMHTETVVVTATRTERQTVSRAAPASVLTAADLQLRPPMPVDDILRATPGFSLFRRSSSRVSNPTTQGATLRGLAASGASRALVLADGIPINDPFGGWVAWNRVPVASIERIEVVRGGASDLYGADALGGVVQVLTTRPARPTLRAEISGGSLQSGRASLFGGIAKQAWDVSVAAEASTTGGYVLVAEDERGPIDVEAGGHYANARAAAGYAGNRWYARAAAGGFTEDRDNGTPVQTNDTRSRDGRIEVGGEVAGGPWRVTYRAASQRYRQVFSSIAPNRATETLTVRQRVPAAEHTMAAEWSRPSERYDVLAGLDLRETSATNHEQGYFPDGRPRSATATSGFQRTSGVFAQTTVRPRPTITLSLGGRGDLRERSRADSLADAEGTISPRATAAWTLAPDIVVRGSIGWSFRAPTLNERYRGFRVGSVITLPNEGLQPERLRTIEAGAFFTPRRASLRMTLFRSDLDRAIANVTVSATPELITRRRENVGGIRVWGGEIESEWTATSAVALTGVVTLLDSRFVDDPVLTDLRVPQVPRWQASGGVRWSAPRAVTIAAQARLFGRQFEDDRNTLELNGAAVFDVTAVRPVGRHASVFVSVENVFNTRYDVGRTPTLTIGQPIGAYVGCRVDLRRQ